MKLNKTEFWLLDDPSPVEETNVTVASCSGMSTLVQLYK